MKISWRLASRLSVVTLALLVVLVIAVVSLRNANGATHSNQLGTPGTNSSGLQGTDLGMLDLGSDAQRVAVVAISVDPIHDTTAAALAFSQEHHMTNYWHFLVGTQNELAPVWSAYAIGAQTATTTNSMHTAVLYVIDQQGHERVLMDQNFTPAQMTSNLKTLLDK